MSKAMPWIKQYPTRLHDVRLAQLNDRQQLRYYQLYLLAGHFNADGAFIQDGKVLKTGEIAFILRVKDVSQLDKDIQSLRKAGLLKVNGHGPYISDFKDEQINWMEKQKADRERQKRSRVSHANVTRDDDVTNAPVTLLDKEEDSEKDSDSESEKKREETPSPLLAGALEKFSRAKINVTEKERAKLEVLLPSLKDGWVARAIKITLESKKHSAAYAIGILRNWRDEHATNRKVNTPGTTQPAPRSGQAPAHSATAAAAKRIVERKRAGSNV